MILQRLKSAINDLITAYIDQTDIIKDLTDENKDYAKAQLKGDGHHKCRRSC